MNRKQAAILLIEDNPGDARLIREMLPEGKGAVRSLEWVENLTVGLQRIARGGIDLVLLDLGLPESVGLETFRRLRAGAGQSPVVVVMSGLEDEGIAAQAVLEGAQDYLIKGQVDGRLLNRSIQYALERNVAANALRRAQDELEARNAELETARDTLEEKVRERSAELEQANQGLQQQIEVHLQTLEALRKSESKYRQLIDTANEGLWMLGPDLMTTFVNTRMAGMIGYSTEQLIGRPFTDFMFEEDVPDHHARMEKRRQGISESYERRIRHKDGKTVWALLSATVIFDEKHRLQGTFAMCTDITERKLAEKYHEMSNEILQILSKPGTLRDSIQSVLTILKTRTGFDAVGIRLRDGNDFPYFVHNGFSDEFLLTENTLIERSMDGCVCRDKDGNIRLECTCGLVISGKTDPANPLFTKGGSAWTNDSFSLLDLPPDQDPRLNPRNQCMHQGYASLALVPIRDKDSIIGLIQFNDHRKNCFSLVAIEQFESIAANIGEALMRKQAEEELHRLNRELRAISRCNEVLVRTQNEQALLKDICRIICNEAGYRLAWVGYVEYDDEKTVRPVAWGGFDDGYVANAKLSWANDAERAQGPGGSAIRSGKTVYIQDFTTDPRMAPWRESALQHGYRSTIAMPLKDENANVFGVLLIYSMEINSFTPYEIRILEELASDLAFGITTLRTRDKRKQAENTLRKSEEQYRLIAENTADTIAVFDLNLNPTYVSPSIHRLRGYSVQEEMTKTLDQILTPDSLQQASKNFADQMALESSGTADPARITLMELEEYCKDGSTIWVEIVASFLRDNNFKPTGILTVTRDITERKQAEKRLKETLERLRKSIDMTIQVLVSALESRDPYTAGHQSRVTHLARAIAREIGLSQDKIEGLLMAGSIHDIGKLSIPAEILSKPAKLTNIELSLIKEHSRIGYEILKDVESPWPLAQIVYQHHERMNGSGYPRNLKGDEILMEARIMAVADVVEAMASHRPYRPGLGIDAALAEIEKNKGIHYDNTVVDACLRLFREKGYQLT